MIKFALFQGNHLLKKSLNGEGNSLRSFLDSYTGLRAKVHISVREFTAKFTTLLLRAIC